MISSPVPSVSRCSQEVQSLHGSELVDFGNTGTGVSISATWPSAGVGAVVPMLGRNDNAHIALTCKD